MLFRSNIRQLIEFHRTHGKTATLTATDLKQRFGVLDLDGNTVNSFKEKVSDGSKINVGYMVLNPEIFDYIEGDKTVFEREPLENLAKAGELKAFFHSGFWQCMDTKREKDMLEKMWSIGKAPWKVWNEL